MFQFAILLAFHLSRIHAQIHSHGSDIYCLDGNGREVLVSVTGTPTGEPPAQYTGCHAHGSEQYCLDPNGNEVQIVTDKEQEMDCHFHAGVEHCVPVGESDHSSVISCEKRDRSYNIPVRVGTLFAVLVTSAVGVFLPFLVERFTTSKLGISKLVFTFFKQFGTGVIVATAFVHLYTHASLMFNNECLGRLSYEATTSAIVMAGIFISFLIEYLSRRFLQSRNQRSITSHESGTSTPPTPKEPIQTTSQIQHHNDHPIRHSETKLSVLVLEAGIIFHSLILGLTLVVAGDSAYITLLIVIVFHQFFEGLALGSRIACLPPSTAPLWPVKSVMATAFALITPIGMAIGIGVLQRFNGSDPGTIVAIGTLDAVSAGILIWVGVVEMWAADWVVSGGEFVDAELLTTAIGGLGLLVGLLLMSVLGKWA